MSASTFSSTLFNGKRPSPADKAKRREDLLAQLRGILAERQVTGLDVAAELRVSRGTAHDYLHRLRAVGEARPTGGFDGHRRALWAKGAGVPGEGNQFDVGAQRAVIVPARQLGMSRHWLDVALFGPAAGAAA